MDVFLADAHRGGAVVTGDGLVVALAASTPHDTLTKLEAQHIALVYRAFGSLHGCDRDEYRQQLGPRFQLSESILADQVFHGSAPDHASASDSMSEVSSVQHHQNKKHLNTNFFCQHVDERPLVDLVIHSKGSTMVIETSDRTLECNPVILDAVHMQNGSPLDGASDHGLEEQPLIFVVHCV